MKSFLLFLFCLCVSSCAKESGSALPATAPQPPVREGLPATEEAWKAKLTPMEYRVLREEGTERAFSGDLLKEAREGTYTCAGCDSPVFPSSAKYKSGTGWPSFFAPLREDVIGTKEDRKLFSVRTEVHCATCKGHLGHVFPDGPEPTGLRYCLNSVALNFVPAGKEEL